MWNELFNMENSFWTFANKVADMVLLEIAWVLTCLPVLTIGAASSAFWHVMVRMARDQGGHVLSNYFHAFGSRWKTATALWLSQLAAAAFLLADIWLCIKMNTLPGVFLVGVFGVLLAILLLFSFWLYPLSGSYPFPWRKVWSNSVFLALRHFPHTLSCILLFALSLVLSWFIPYAFLVLPVLACYMEAKAMAWIFSKYDSQEEPEDEADL